MLPEGTLATLIPKKRHRTSNSQFAGQDVVWRGGIEEVRTKQRRRERWIYSEGVTEKYNAVGVKDPKGKQKRKGCDGTSGELLCSFILLFMYYAIIMKRRTSVLWYFCQTTSTSYLWLLGYYRLLSDSLSWKAQR